MEPSVLEDYDYIKSIWTTGRFSDFTIKCGDHSWNVHRLVLGSRSTYFEKVFEPIFREGHESEITLYEDDEVLVGRMLAWCYIREYGEYAADDNYAQKAILDAQMHGLADKYCVESLKMETCDRLATNFSKALRFRLQTPIQDISTVIKLAYTLTPASDRDIRREILNSLRLYYFVFNPLEEFQKLLKSNLADGDFASDILTTWVETANKQEFLCECPREPHNEDGTVTNKCSGCISRELKSPGTPPKWRKKIHIHPGDSPDSVYSLLLV